MSAILNAAVEYNSKGYSVIPIGKGKRPLVEWKQYQQERAEEARIRCWWGQWPEANVGIITGAVSGIVVVDIEAGGSTEGWSPTAMCRTQGGGWHLYYRHPGHPVANGTRVRELTDIRGDGGYVVAPPSVGQKGAYEWIVGFDAAELAPFPEALLKSGTDAVDWARIDRGVAAGERNDAAAKLAGRWLAAAREEQWESDVWRRLTAWNARNSPPLPEGELRSTFESITQRERGKRERTDGDGESSGSTIASRFVELALHGNAELFHDEFKEAFIRFPLDGHWEVWPVRSRTCRLWLNRLAWVKEQRSLKAATIEDVVSVLESKALFEGKSHHLSLRIARTDDGSVWYDLADDGWRAVRITQSGWSIEQAPPILFRRYSHQKSQVAPECGGDIRAFLDFVNIIDDRQRLLLLVYLVACLIPDFPHPVPILYGAHGAAKTMLFRLARLLIDPSAIGVLELPSGNDELVQLLAHHWFAPFDNVEHLPRGTSDTLCRAITGTGSTKRALYTDDDDVCRVFRRCIGINGINLVATKADLLDRSILFALERIPPERRKDERAIYADFLKRLPAIFGGAFDVLARALAIYPSVELQRLPRMADFAKWGCAIAQALGYSAETFIAAYDANIKSQNDELLSEHAVASALITLLDECGAWEGTAAQLLKDMRASIGRCGEEISTRNLPRSASALSRRLNEIMPNLIDAGIIIEKHPRSADRRSWMEIRREASNAVIGVMGSEESQPSRNAGDGTMMSGDAVVESVPSLESSQHTEQSALNDGNDGDFLASVREVFPDAQLES